jgi:hypothetical protein
MMASSSPQLMGKAVPDPRQFKFDAEKRIEDLREYQSLAERARNMVYQLKESLRTGGSAEEIQEWRALMMGYMALETVLKRSREGRGIKSSEGMGT